jgi:hypothetical protein
MISRTAGYLFIGLAIFSIPASPQESHKPAREMSFRQFPVKVYEGRVKVPKGLHKDPDGAWRDEEEKWVADPQVNFAGEYYLSGHSCGTCCRYYTLNNLRTGRELDAVSMFDAGDTPPRTKDGHTYVPILFFKPDSRLLIVQYDLDPCTSVENNQCRQRYFVFDNGRFKAISRTTAHCTQEGQEHE